RGYEEYQRAPSVMWRTNEWKLILHLPGRLDEALGHLDRTQGELYRLTDDPLELHNLYHEPAYERIREMLTIQLLMYVICALGRYPLHTARTRIRIREPEARPDLSIWTAAKA
ncbi:MAG: hypothetical protein ACUVWX_10880, partial [Kiritimatiellia bacterium]